MTVTIYSGYSEKTVKKIGTIIEKRVTAAGWTLFLILIAMSGCQWGPSEPDANAVAAIGDLPNTGVLAVSRMIKHKPANEAASFMGIGAPYIEDRSLLIYFIENRKIVGKVEIPGILSSDVTFDPKSTSWSARVRIGQFGASSTSFNYYDVTRTGTFRELPALHRSVKAGGCGSRGSPSVSGIVIQPSGDIAFDEQNKTLLSQCRVYQKDF